MALKHAFSSSKADGADSTLVQPSNWNSDHSITNVGGTGSILFVSGTGITGSNNLFYDTDAQHLEISGASGALCFFPTTTTTAPVGEPNEVFLFGTIHAGRRMLAVKDASGSDYELGNHISSTRIYSLQANGDANSYTMMGGAAATATGTATACTWANTNVSSTFRRVSHVSLANAGNASGLRGPAAYYSIGDAAGKGGFYFVSRFIVAATASAATRVVCGFLTSTANPTNVDASTIFNMFGVCKDSADTTYQFMHNDGTGTATKVSTGLSATQGDVMEVKIWCPPNASQIGMHCHILSVGGTGTIGLKSNSTDYTATTDLPANTVGLNWHTYVQTSAATAIRAAIMNVTVETDY